MKKENVNTPTVENQVSNTMVQVNPIYAFFPFAIFDDEDECIVDDLTRVELTPAQIIAIAEVIEKNHSENVTLDHFHDIEQEVVDQVFAEEFARQLPDVDEDDYCDYYVHVNYPLPQELLEAVSPFLKHVWLTQPFYINIEGKEELHSVKVLVPVEILNILKELSSEAHDGTDYEMLKEKDTETYKTLMALMSKELKSFCKWVGGKVTSYELREFPYEVYGIFDQNVI